MTVSFMYGLVSSIASELPQLEPGKERRTERLGYIYASDGKTVLAVLRGSESRIVVESEQISPVMKQAIVAVEDRRFWEHQGVDIQGMARAVWADLRSQDFVQGGSTITQQFIKNQYTQQERTVSRKLKEAALAWQLEQRWSKDRILTAYLNTIYFGNGAYGIEMAARVYFDKHAKELTLPEARSSPACRRARAPTTRREPRGGQEPPDHRSPPDARAGPDHGRRLPDRRRVASAPRRRDRSPGLKGRVGHFAEYVKQQLVPYYGSGEVFGGGLKIYTSIDLELQRLAHEAIDRWLPGPRARRRPRRHRPARRPRARDGRRRELPQEPVQPRRPGPAPDGLGLQAVRPHRRGRAGNLAADGLHLRADRHQPRRQALVGAQLRRLLPRVDRPPGGHHLLRQLGLRAADRAGGAEERRRHGAPARGHPAARRLLRHRARRRGRQPARDGARRSPRSRTAASGSTARCSATCRAPCSASRTAAAPTPTTPSKKQAVDANDAAIVTSILQRVVTEGTGQRAALDDRPVAGKTGTTENYGDAWFVGYTPQLAVAVWVGYPDRLKPMETEFEGDPVAGGTFPALIWQTFAERALAHLEEPPESFPYPSYQSVVARQVVYRDNKTLLDNGNCKGVAADPLLRRLRAERRGGLQAERGRRPERRRLAPRAAKDQLYSMPLTADVIWRPARPGERLGPRHRPEARVGTLSSWSTVRIVLPRPRNGRVPDVVGLDVDAARSSSRSGCSGSRRPTSTAASPASSSLSSRGPASRRRGT